MLLIWEYSIIASSIWFRWKIHDHSLHYNDGNDFIWVYWIVGGFVEVTKGRFLSNELLNCPENIKDAKFSSSLHLKWVGQWFKSQITWTKKSRRILDKSIRSFHTKPRTTNTKKIICITLHNDNRFVITILNKISIRKKPLCCVFRMNI